MSLTYALLGTFFVVLGVYGVAVGVRADDAFIAAHSSYRLTLPLRPFGLAENATALRVGWVLSTAFVGLVGLVFLTLSV